MKARFVRGQEPIDSMELGDVMGRKMKKAREEMLKAIKKLFVAYRGKITNDNELIENPYMRIKETTDADYTEINFDSFIEIGIEFTPEGPKGKYYYAYIVYCPGSNLNPEEPWAAGYVIKDSNESIIIGDIDEIPYETIEEALSKMEYYIKNFKHNEISRGIY